jgi:hypothetical protein
MLYMMPGQLLQQLPLLHLLLRDAQPGCQGKCGKHTATDQLPHLCSWAARWAQVGMLLQEACDASERRARATGFLQLLRIQMVGSSCNCGGLLLPAVSAHKLQVSKHFKLHAYTKRVQLGILFINN